jgi:glycosyltransferase involved in cell wall biosynthesis
MTVRVALIVKQFVPYRIRIFHEISRLSGVDAHFIFDAPPTPEDREILEQFPFAYSVIPTNIALPRALFVHGRFRRYLPLGLYRLLRELRPDVVVCPEYSLQSGVGGFYAKRHGAKLVIWASLTKLGDCISFPLQAQYRQWLRKRAASFICYSKLAVEYLESHGVHPERCFVAENCTDVLFFRANGQRPPSANDEVRITFIGALTDVKRPEDVLLALRPLVDIKWRLTMVGTGELRDELEPRAAEWFPGRVHFTGQVGRSRVRDILLSTDVFVFPTKYDPWAHVIDEAMAAGCAVVSSSNSVAALELLDDGVNGLVYPSGDVSRLTSILQQLLSDPIRIAALGRAAERTMERHNELISVQGIQRAIAFVRVS